MKVILFLAAVYALIYNQTQQKKPPVAQPRVNINYTHSTIKDSVIKYTPIPSTYIEVPPSILNVTAAPAVMKTVNRETPILPKGLLSESF